VSDGGGGGGDGRGQCAGLPISLTISAPICSSATFAVRPPGVVCSERLASFMAGRTAMRVARQSRALLNYRPGPTENGSAGVRSMSTASGCLSQQKRTTTTS